MNLGPILNLGAWRPLDGSGTSMPLLVPAMHLTTHGVIVGMTGSGKTGLVTVLVEEALRAGIPTLVIDVKGDLPNLLLSFPNFDLGNLAGWVDPGTSPEALIALNEERRESLADWEIDEAAMARYDAETSVRVITPGLAAGEPLHVLSGLERRSSRWDTDPEGAADTVSAAVSLVLRLLGRDPDPARSRDHVLLSVLATNRLSNGMNADLPGLIADLENPPIESIGALSVESFLRKTDRRKLAAALNNLLASPSFGSWRKGMSLDVASWLTPTGPQTPAVVVSVAHLDDEERGLVLGMVLEEVLCWVRSLSGSQRLRALVVFDEVYGFLPPYPSNPPTKRPMVALMKQARAFGVGVVVATQNPMDLDYRALSNAGLWFLGRLQTDSDRERVIDGLGESGGAESGADLNEVVQRLSPRWFVVRDARASSAALLMQPRHTISLLRGPMTRGELRRARHLREGAVPVWEGAETRQMEHWDTGA